MPSTDINPESRQTDHDDRQPALKVYTPKLEEFEEAVAHAVKRYHELPDWLKASMKGRFRAR